MKNNIINMEFSNACKEVLEILKFINDDEVSKIPTTEIEMLKQNANYEHEFCYDHSINIKEQNVSKMTRAIIANLFVDYIATPSQKEKIQEKWFYEIKKNENEKSKNYEADIFKKKESENLNKVHSEEKSLVKIQEEKWYKKIWKYIKNFFIKRQETNS